MSAGTGFDPVVQNQGGGNGRVVNSWSGIRRPRAPPLDPPSSITGTPFE